VPPAPPVLLPLDTDKVPPPEPELLPPATVTVPPVAVAAEPPVNDTAPADAVVVVPEPDFKVRPPPALTLSPAVTLTPPETPVPVDDPLLIATPPLCAPETPPAALDNVNTPLALPELVADPDETVIDPLFPVADTPLLNTSFPLTPLAPLSADFIVTTPDEYDVLLPDDKVTKPPVAGFPVPAEVEPAVTVTLPPAPEFPAPTVTAIAPPKPAVAAPVLKDKAPEFPHDDVPLLNVNVPLTPTEPAFGDLITTAPLEVPDDTPDDSVNEPP
jgi:hypothetical protein